MTIKYPISKFRTFKCRLGVLILILFFQFKTQAQSGECLNFDGVNDYVVVNSGFNLGNTWTAEAWIKPTNLFGNWNTVLGQAHWNNGEGFVIAVQNGSVFATGPSGFDIQAPITGGVWTHVALTYNNGIWAFYKNGYLVGTQTATFTNASARPFYLGMRDINNATSLIDPYQGDIDEVRIWNTVRTQCEIQSYMNYPIPNTSTGLIGNYHFNVGTANGINYHILLINEDNLPDLSGNNKDGQLINFGLGSPLGGSTSNWTTPGPVLSSIPAPFSTADIRVRGNGNIIADGDVTPSTTDFTDFGTNSSRTFVIENIGTTTLNVAKPMITGPGASQFSITSLPATFLATSTGSTSFVVTFTPTSTGVKTATLHIYNSACAEQVYDFAITATATPAQCIHFDGVNDFIETNSNITELGQGDFTIETWLKTTGTDFGIVSCIDNDGVWEAGEKSFYTENDGTVHFVGYACNYIHSNYPINDNNWHHVAVVWDWQVGVTGVGKIFIDGVDRTSGCDYAANTSNLGTFKIGQHNNNECTVNFPGQMDELRIWNVARSQCEIQTYMNCEIPTTSTGLLANYHFNQGLPSGSNTAVSTLTSSANAINGTLVNFMLNGATSNWVNPSIIPSNYTTVAVPVNEIDVTGNGNSIADGSIGTSTVNFTDFGSALSRTFVIHNTVSPGTLHISAPYLNGTNANQFSITVLPSTSLTGISTTSFVVTFIPTSNGVKVATVNIPNSDCSEPVYDFVIRAMPPTGEGLKFDGVNDYVSIPEPVFGTSDLTVEAWIKPNSLSAAQLITNRTSECCANGNWWALATSNGSVSIEMADCNTTYTAINTPPMLVNGAWNHIAWVRSGSEISLYVNGVLGARCTDFTVRDFQNSASGVLNFGVWNYFPPVGWFNGEMDEVRLWTVAKTQCEIQTYMNCEIPTTATGLIGNYHFTNGAAGLTNTGVTLLTDVSGSSRNGTLFNFSLTGTGSNWVAPGAVITNYSVTSQPTVEINVTGNGNNIPDGTTSVSTTNFTDFGGAYTRTFVVQNTVPGGTLNYAPYITGPNSNQFLVTTFPASSITAVGSQNFAVTFTPTSVGTKTAILNINNNDCSEPVYDFVLSADPLIGSALSLDGIDDYVNLGNTASLKSNAFTVETWAYRSSWSGTFTILGNMQLSGFKFKATGTNLNATCYRNGGFAVINYPQASITPGWHHFAMTYDGRYFNYYFDGNLVGTNDAGGNFPINYTANNTLLGAEVGTGSLPTAGGDYFGGMIDEVRFWNVVRTPCEIFSYKDCEIPSNATGLVANYHFNQGVASGSNTAVTTLTDATTNAINGTLMNMALTGGTVSNWVDPGAVVSGFTTPTAPQAEINVTGNGNNIADGSTVANVTNHTDFGTSMTRTFVIQNTGTDPLNPGPVYITGVNASEFSIVALPSQTVLPGGSSSLVVAFLPISVGVKNSTVNILNNDCSEPLYDFVITGTAQAGAALKFDGVNDYIETNANITETGKGDFTIEAWIRTTGTAQGIVVCQDADNVWEVGEKCFYIDQFGVPTFVGFDNEFIHGTIPVNDGNPHHVAVTWDYTGGVNGIGKIYVDGVDQTGVVSYSAIANNAGTFKIGMGNFNNLPPIEAPNYFAGEMDEVRIWNRALCLPEIISNMNCELFSPATQPGLMAYYNFNNALAGGVNTTFSTAATLGPVVATGTLNGFALSGLNSNWIAPGAVTSGSSCTAYQGPEINVQGNLVNIVDGDFTPSTADFTDFNTTATRVFSIQNVGTTTLGINLPITITGVNASEFSVIAQPASSVIAAGNAATFAVAFTGTLGGIRSATINISSTDCDEAVYDFAIQAILPGAVLAFDGNDYINNIPGQNLNNQSFTIEFWAKRNTNNTPDFVYANGINNTNTGLHIGFYDFGNFFIFGFWNNDLAVPLSDFSWHHWACVFQAGTTSGLNRFIYRDGILVASDRSNSNFVGSGNTLIGGTPWFPTGDAFDGYIDELRVWNVARSQCEIQSYMNCEIPGAMANLIGNYHFNQGVAEGNNTTITTLIDASGNNNNGTLNGFSLTGSISNFVTPGAVVSNFTTVATPSVEIEVSGNAIIIADGDLTPSAADHTDFGTVSTRTFVISNTGAGALNTGTVVIHGPNSSEFSITTQPSTLIATGGSSSLVIAFTPTSGGIKSATVSIFNSDCSEPIYDFGIQATTPTAEYINFDGVGDYIQTPIDADNNVLTATTWEAWIRPTIADPSFRQIISIDDGGWDRFLGMNSGSVVIGAGYQWIPTSFDVNQWQHIALVYTGNTVRFYKNGVEYEAPTTQPLGMSTASITLGCRALPVMEFFQGDMDEVRVWNVARTQCEIQTYMNCEIPSSSPGLIANYHFNQGAPALNNSTVTTLTDASGSANNGTLTNIALTGSVSNWLSPSIIVSGFTTTAMPQVEIEVFGNGISIADGDITPSTADHTDFASSSSRTFVIQNTGTGVMNISTPYFTGPNASEFSISVVPAATLNTGGSTTMVIVFTPTTTAVKTATVNIGNNDCSEPIYDFVITGTPVPASALALDGIDDYVEIPNSSANNFTLTNAFTVEFWAKTNQDFGGGTLVNKGSGSGQEQYSFDFAATDFRYYILNAAGSFTHIQIPRSSVITVADGWVHIAGVYDGNARMMRLYRNGVEIASSPTSSVPLMSNGNPLCIGAQAQPSLYAHFNGQIDELRLWNVARTQCEIQTYMNAEIPSTAPGLTANYHFNQGIPSGINTAVTTLTDAVGGSDGTLINFALNGSTSNWVSPGPFASGSTTLATPLVEIDVLGNGSSIADGDVTPSTADHTDFGSAPTRTFIIQNTGTGVMNITAPYITGVNASEFSVSLAPVTTLNAGASTSLVIAFTPTTGGVRMATVNIGSNDCSEPLYDFVIQGTPPGAEALHLDGVNDFIQVPHVTSMNFGTNVDFTAEAMVQFTANLSGFQGVVSKAGAGGVWTGYQLAIYQNKVIAELGTSSFGLLGLSQGLLGTTLLNDGQWHHIALVVSRSTNNVKIYVDGKEEVNVTHPFVSGDINTSANTFIGAERTNIGYFEGNIDEVRVWNVARSQCELQTYMNCEIPTTAPGLLANYHFNQGAAGLNNSTVTALTDASGNSNNGTLYTFGLNGTTSNWVLPGPFPAGYSVAVTPAVEIDITGNGTIIPDGATTTSTLDFTDFGSSLTRTFVIHNTGSGTLNLGVPYLTGTNATDFTITTLPSPLVNSGSTTSMVIAFTPTTVGVKTATLNLSNSDCTEPTYDFVITATAVTGAALNLDGVNDRAGTTVFNTANNNITLQAKVLWAGPTSTNQVIAYNGNSSMTGYGFYVVQGTNSVNILHGGNVNIYSGCTLTPGQWTSLSMVIDNGVTHFYMNGVETFSGNIGLPNTPIGNFAIGSNEVPSEYFNGSIDEVLFWNIPRSQCEIVAYQDCEIPGAFPGLVANYHFNQAVAGGYNLVATTVNDASGNNYHLNISGMALTGQTSNWIAPGGVVSGSITPLPLNLNAEINITGNSNTITAGTTTTSVYDFTDFGNTLVNSVITKTFVIENTGTGSLSINGYSLTGTNATNFTVTTPPATSLAASGSTSIIVSFSAATNGVYDATLTIFNDDCNESNYNFNIRVTTANLGQALHFKRDNPFAGDYIEVPHSSSIDLGADFTLEAWVNYQGINATIVDKGDYDFNFQINTFGTGNIGFYSRNEGVWAYSTGTVTPGVWNHVAAALSAGTMTFYINGQPSGTASVAYSQDNGPMNIGRQQPSVCACNQFDGSMDELRIWNVARSCSEIMANMNNELLGTESGLVAYYNFNQGYYPASNPTETVVIDLTGVNNGTLVGFDLTGSISNWVQSGAGVTGTVPALYSEVNVKGNGNNILFGATTTSTLDFTDYGLVCAGTANTHTFVIENTGTGTLSIATISLSGTDASMFTLAGIPSSVNATSNASFVVTFTPTTPGTKTATLHIISSDCDESDYSFALSGTVEPQPTVAATSGSICSGESFTIVPSGAGGGTYSITGNTFTVNPAVTTSYSVTGTGTNNCVSANTAVVTITVFTTPTISVNSGTICSGENFVINPTGAGIGGTYIIAGGSATVSPPTNSFYPVTGTSSAGCVASNTVNSDVTVHITPTVTASDGTICAGQSFTIPLSGASTYTVSGGTATVSPLTNTFYTIIGTSAEGCVSSNTAVSNVTVHTAPTIAVTSGSICSGESFTIIPSGAGGGTYTISGNTFTVSPGVTTSYSVTGTNTAGCVSINTAVSTITVDITPTITVNSGTVCSGLSFVISPTGAVNYTYSTGSATFIPTSTTNYSVTGTSSAGCVSTNTAIGTVTVFITPTISVNSTTICSGESFTIVPSGADSYSVTGGTFVVTPPGTTSYSVTGSSSVGCIASNTAVSSVSVNITPTVAVTSGTICEGLTFTMVPSGASTFTFSNGSNTVNPLVTTSYSVTGTATNGCVSGNTAVCTVTVDPTPIITVNSGTLCSGQVFTMVPGGASTYTFSNGSATVNPIVNTSYSVIGTSSAGCVSTTSAVASITVEITPTVTVNSGTICAGTDFTIIPSGANTYSFEGGSDVVNPTSNSQYTVVGISVGGCNSSPVTSTVDVNPLPVITTTVINSVICVGGTVSVNAAGAATLTWSDGLTNNTPFTPTVTSTYTVTGIDNIGCEGTANVTVTVNPLPVLEVSSSNSESCEAETVTLTLSGADTYTWNASQVTSSVVISPSVSTTFTITGVDVNGCMNTQVYTQTVSPCLGTITALATGYDVSCGGKSDGRIILVTSSTYTNATTEYIWTPQTLCPDNNCTEVDSLSAGNYSVKVKVTYTLNASLVRTDSAIVNVSILSPNGPCNMKIYNGVSANGDGVNDVFEIENITEFPHNKVSIYNRWGTLMYETTGYNNRDKAWPQPSEASSLQTSTYFYIIDPGDGSPLIKGWVELMRN